jgi:WXG100 family type VII secretion target
MSDQDLAYEHAAISAMAGELKSFVGRIDTQLATHVEKEFNALRASGFTGAASDQFAVASTAWNNKTREMMNTLDQLQLAVQNASTDMDGKDKSLQGLFPG